MRSDIDSWRLKLANSERHIALLRMSFDHYLLESNARIVAEVRQDPQPHPVFAYRADYSPPPEWGPMIGDCLHNLRSALDHLFFALPRDPATKLREDQIYFPCSSIWNPQSPTMRGLSTTIVQAVERAQAIPPWDLDSRRVVGPGIGQPGFGRRLDRNHPLDVLRRLSNSDKHRVLVVGASGYGHIGWLGGSPIEPGRHRPLDDGDVVMEFAPGADPQITGLSLDIMFDDGFPGYGAWVSRELDRIAEFVGQRVFPEIERVLA